jgi:hypothetical protein
MTVFRAQPTITFWPERDTGIKCACQQKLTLLLFLFRSMPIDDDDSDDATRVATERRGGRPRSYASGMPRTAASTRAQGTLKLPPTIHRVNSQLNPPFQNTPGKGRNTPRTSQRPADVV